MCSCHSILECCVTFSGVKLSIRSFVLFQEFTVKDATLIPGELVLKCIEKAISPLPWPSTIKSLNLREER